jgi:ATP-dependent DNA helicase RecQ
MNDFRFFKISDSTMIASPMALKSNLESLLKKYFGYDEFRPHQQEIIRSVIARQDVFALLPTGGGKSLCFQLPAVASTGLTLVISPLIALMKDQVDALTASGIPATFLNSSIDREEMNQRVRELDAGKYRLLYVAPERAVLPDFLQALQKWNLNLIAIDEAHCISEWGHDFRPEYRRIPELRQVLPAIPMLALTATATLRVRQDIVQLLKLRDPQIFIASFNRPNLTYRVAARSEASDQVIQFIKDRPGESGIVYCLSRKGTESLAGDLKAAGIKALPYHAGLSAEQRTKHQEKFLRDDVQVICATIAFGMGINKSNVRFVIHRDLPKNVEGYYQETGRAGRDGLRSDCLLLFSRGDVVKLSRFIQQISKEEERRTASAQLDTMVSYAESIRCRRSFLLRYFGEELTGNCGACDICLKDSFDSTIAAKKFLSCIYRVHEAKGMHLEASAVADILLGSRTNAVLEHKHDQLSTFGIGLECSKSDWLQIAVELKRLGYVRVNFPKSNVLELTPEGRSFLTNKQAKLEIKKLEPFPAPREERSDRPKEERPKKHRERKLRKRTLDDAPFDDALFEKLRQIRKELADARNVPPYVIFSDATLQDMARIYPISEPDFGKIIGVGERKLKDFAQTFTAAIRDFLASNRKLKIAPEDLSSNGGAIPKSVQMFASGADIEQVAENLGLAQSTVYRHLFDAIDSGFELPRERFFTEAEWNEIMAVYRESSGPLKPLFEELSGKYSYDRLRIFRLYAPARVAAL